MPLLLVCDSWGCSAAVRDVLWPGLLCRGGSGNGRSDKRMQPISNARDDQQPCRSLTAQRAQHGWQFSSAFNLLTCSLHSLMLAQDPALAPLLSST